MFMRVSEFHKAFGHPVSLVPSLPEHNIRNLRRSLINEELTEYCEAFDKHDRVEMADALADLLYVLAGTAVAYGIAPDTEFISPQEGADPLPLYRTDYDEMLCTEFNKYSNAEKNDDLSAIERAIYEMIYLIFTIARQSRIPINAIFSEVHRSNMSKLDDNGKPVLREDGKVLKSNRYQPPQIAAILANV